MIFDQAALRLGLVVVPLYTADRAENIAYVIGDSGARLVLFESIQKWLEVASNQLELSSVEAVLVLQDSADGDPEETVRARTQAAGRAQLQ